MFYKLEHAKYFGAYKSKIHFHLYKLQGNVFRFGYSVCLKNQINTENTSYFRRPNTAFYRTYLHIYSSHYYYSKKYPFQFERYGFNKISGQQLAGINGDLERILFQRKKRILNFVTSHFATG